MKHDNDYKFDEWLARARNESSDLSPSDEVWSQIQRDTQVQPPQESWLNRLIDSLTPGPRLQSAFAVTAMVILVVFLFVQKEPGATLISENDAAILASELDQKVLESQQLYEEVIIALEKQVKAEIPDSAHEVFALYQQKIQMLDEMIAECKVNLQENPYSPAIHRTIFYAYTEKLTNLRTMLELNKELTS